MLNRVAKAVRLSVGIADSSKPPCRPGPDEPSKVSPTGSFLDRFNRYTPEKMIKKPQRSDNVFVASVVLNPLNMMNDAHRVAVVKVT
jgi:hypothetical protein